MDQTLAQIISKFWETTAALNTAQQKIAELEARIGDPTPVPK